MSAADRDRQAQALRAEGLSYLEIGRRMGEHSADAWARCKRAQKRERDRKFRAEAWAGANTPLEPKPCRCEDPICQSPDEDGERPRCLACGRFVRAEVL